MKDVWYMDDEEKMVLAIESSTSSAKAVLYGAESGAIDWAQESYGPELEQNGKTDTEGVFDLAVEMAKKVLKGRQVEAVALCGTWHSLAVCDDRMNPVTPTFSWNFTGTAPICAELRKDEELTERLYRTTGCMPHNTYERHIVTYLRQQGMYLDDKKFITQGGYIFYRLTGEFVESCCTHSGTGLINLEKLDYDEFVLDYLNIGRKQLGQLAFYDDTRPLSVEGARLLGLRPGVPVVPAHADGALNQIGNYANAGGNMTMSVGTSGAIRMAVEKPTLAPERQLWCYYGTDKWICGAASAGACNCVDWFVQDLLGGSMTYEQLERGRSGKQPERDVPVFLPFLFGERCPGWDDRRRGGFLYVDGSHSAGDLYEALQMGILFNLYQCYLVLCEENGEPERIILSGGINNSDIWLQMAANIFERDVLAARWPNASSMGAVALALHACGCLDDINDFEADFKSASVVPCNRERFAYYRRQFDRYVQAYETYRR